MRCVSASGITTPVAADAAPALGEVPEQRLQAPVDARELRDRLRRREPQRALGEPVEQRGRDLRVLRRPRRRSGGRARRASTGESTLHSASTGSSSLFDAACHGPDQVARAEQLGADVVGDDQLAGDHALEHEQADVVGARARRGARRPRGRRRGGGCSRAAGARPRRGAARRAAPPRSGSALSSGICSVLMRPGPCGSCGKVTGPGRDRSRPRSPCRTAVRRSG